MESEIFSWQLQIMSLAKEKWPNRDGEYQYNRYIREITNNALEKIRYTKYDFNR